jgi:pullulanase/glycogen debranching enzyme
VPELENDVQKQRVEMWPGRPYPLGATFDGTGVNFALFSEVASKVELCLISEDGEETCKSHQWPNRRPRVAVLVSVR